MKNEEAFKYTIIFIRHEADFDKGQEKALLNYTKHITGRPDTQIRANLAGVKETTVLEIDMGSIFK